MPAAARGERGRRRRRTPCERPRLRDRARPRSAGRRRDPRIPWVYVGSSARDAEIRFDQHRRGYKSAGPRQALRAPPAPRPLRRPARVPQLPRGLRGGGASAPASSPACGFVAHSDGTSHGSGEGGWEEWDDRPARGGGGPRRRRGARALRVVVQRPRRRALRSPAPRRARLLGRRAHRSRRPAARLRPASRTSPRAARAAGGAVTAWRRGSGGPPPPPRRQPPLRATVPL